MDIGERIQSLRKMQGISQDELADKIGVSRQAVSKWENQQSIPDLDKVLMLSDYFGVTTDHILKGVEIPQQEIKNFNTSQLLYIASTALLVIGLLSAFDGWYSEQSADMIWGAMIIQVVGAAAYFTGKFMGQSKAPFMINWLNIIIVLFMPVSMIVTSILYVVAPYPTDLLSTFVFTVVYIMIVALSYFALKKYTK